MITTAKRPDTRGRRLAALIAESARGERIGHLAATHNNGRER
jgi:hypothetical protein